MTTIEDRVSRLEGAYDHLATKADIAELRGELRGSMRAMYWIMGAIGVELAALTLILKFVD